jgi:hypothetical protein
VRKNSTPETIPSEVDAVARTYATEFSGIVALFPGAVIPTWRTEVVGALTEVTLTVTGFDVSVFPVAELLSLATAVRVYVVAANGCHGVDKVTDEVPPTTVPIEAPFTRKSMDETVWFPALDVAVAANVTGELGATVINDPFAGVVMLTDCGGAASKSGAPIASRPRTLAIRNSPREACGQRPRADMHFPARTSRATREFPENGFMSVVVTKSLGAAPRTRLGAGGGHDGWVLE